MITIQSHIELNETIHKYPIVIMQFGSEICSPCSALKQRIEIWNKDHTKICHTYVTVDDQPKLCAQMGIFTVPSIIVYVEGKVTIRQSGYFSLDQMLDQIEKYERLLFDDSKK